MPTRLVGVALVAALLAPAPALAKQSTDAKVKELVKQGQAQYTAGDYASAVQTLQKAYELKPIPTLLFNIARAYDKAGDAEHALGFYRRYRDSSPDDAKLLGEASRAIDRLEAAQREKEEKKRAEDAAREQQRKQEEERLAAERAKLEQQQAEAQKAQQLREQQQLAPKPRSRAVPYALIGVGGAAVLGGGVLGLTAKSLADDEKASTDPIAKPDLRSRAKTRALAADVAYGVGAAALATGIVLILTEPKPAAEAPVSAVPQPLLFDHGAGLAWGGSL